MEIRRDAAAALMSLERAGFESYVVGGCVRDSLMGLVPHDWDICTAAPPEKVKAVFAGERVLETGLRHGTVTLLTEEGPLEITTFRAETGYSDGRHPDRVAFVSDIKEDLSRRDFTVNAMAYSPVRGLVDEFGGREDLKNGLLRCVGEPERRFEEDSLRILRALRFAARFGFTVDTRTGQALRDLRQGLTRVSGERIFAELKGILCAPCAAELLRQFPEVIFTVLPELEPLYGFDQEKPRNHIYDGWEHTLHAIEAIPPEAVLRLAMLFHDCGKPRTYYKEEDTGTVRYRNHPLYGATLADAALRRLRCDNATRETVCTLIANHELRTGHTRPALRRLMAEIGPENMKLLLEVRRADAMAHAPACGERLMQLRAQDAAYVKEILENDPCLSKKDLRLTGGELIAAGWDRGPEVSETMDRLFSEVLDERLENNRDALRKRASELRKELRMGDSVAVTWLGHSCFRLTYHDWSLVVDPYADGSVDGLPPLRVRADRVYMSHSHRDHAGGEAVDCSGAPAPAGFAAQELDTPHDHHEGARRGRNAVRIFRFGTLRVAHLGDLGCLPEEKVLSALGGVDCLLLPVGGYYTIGAEEARELCSLVQPGCIVPMHYRGDGFGYEVIAPAENFTALFPGVTPLNSDTFTLTKEGPRGVLLPRLLP